MTEPTHHLRADVAAQLDMAHNRIWDYIALGDAETSRVILLAALADAWHHGWMTGHEDGHEGRKAQPNPYHETDNA